ncbi:DUF262 domain-containing protein [Sorangium sp. So ce295]|uniref:DUF262 domain-containing protein n=1 Tax=Sorangium sp. So ce295 TaxID=3133295 RepID=UPI003F646394
MGLKEEIDRGRSTIHTDGYPMSIGELLSLYRDGELDIHPEFQRFFRWNDLQKSRLIESLLLGIPIPSIFVAQRKDGVWDVVDGLQRLSTIFQLVGVLKDEQGQLVEPLVLRATKYLPSLEGKRWEDDTSPENALEQERLIIKRSKIDVKIILRESDEQSKFELFQRLNTGGSALTEQELRNCIMVMVNRDFFAWIRSLGQNTDFKQCTALSERLLDEQYDLDLVTRFIVLRTIAEAEVKGVRALGEFITDRVVALAKDDQFDRKREEDAFAFTFGELARTLGDSSFQRRDEKTGKYRGAFLISAYEAIAIGLGHNSQAWMDSSTRPDVDSLVKQLWSNARFVKATGAGGTAQYRLPVTIPVGREIFRP